jgi:hypothetical protein
MASPLPVSAFDSSHLFFRGFKFFLLARNGPISLGYALKLTFTA